MTGPSIVYLRRWSYVVMAASAVLWLCACESRHRLYRGDLTRSVQNKVEDTGNSSAVWTTPDGKPYFGFVEFDDMGERWDSSRRASLPDEAPATQLQAVTNAIKDACNNNRGRPFFLIVFAHGWNHNAKKNDENLQQFHQRIRQLRELQSRSGAEVFGVYMAWRGDANFFPINFFHRSEGGHRVGERATGVIYSLIAAGREASSNSKIVLIGHSFGCHLIEGAVLPVLQAEVANAGLNGGVKPSADLVLLVNSARSSLYSKPFIDQLRDSRLKLEKQSGPTLNRLPLLVSVTSSGDSSTGTFFPLGIALGRRLSYMNTMVSGVYRRDDSDPVIQRVSHQHTIGWNKALHSHDVILEDFSPAGSNPEEADGHPDDSYLEADRRAFTRMIRANYQPWQPDGSILIRGRKHNYRVIPKVKPYNDTPYWVMQVPKKLIKDHNDIWNDDYAALVTAMLFLPAPQIIRKGADTVKEAPPAALPGELTRQKLMLKAVE